MAVRPLTEKTLDQYIQLLAREDGGLACDDVDAPGPPNMRPQMPQGKLEHIFRYIDDQLNSSQDSVPMTPAMSRAQLVSPERGGGGDAAEALDARPRGEAAGRRAMRQLRKGKRTLRKGLHMPVGSAQPDSRSPPGDAVACLGPVQARPSSIREQRPRPLGIFNRGRAAVSTNAGMAFSEGGFMHGANICRVRPGDDGRCAPLQPSRVDSGKDCLWAADEAAPSGHASRRASHGSGSSASYRHGGHESVDGAGVTAECSQPRSSERSSGPWSLPRPTSLRKQRAGTVHPAPAAAACGSVPRNEEPELDPLLPAGDVEPDDLAAAHAELYRSCLLESIDACLAAEPRQGAGLSHSCSSDSLNISMLFDDQNADGSSTFDIHNCSPGALSVFDSSFFASQELPMSRCAGDITVSDFGNSRHALAQRSANLPMWTTRSAESIESLDTLPEYVSRLELPPPYSRVILGEAPRLNSPRANISLTAHPAGNWGQSLAGHRSNSPNPAWNSSAAESRFMLDSYDPVDFRVYPRHMC
ncbi:hypothetical protein GGF46_004309 [Coemansia sp. RSA 552]|nr:hypothetical protein GGF46_004309 [Coemansia sp. RSA 552]